MKKYLVEITETSQRQVTVTAETRDEAEQKVRQKYRDEEIVLDERDYIDTDFHVIKERSIDNKMHFYG
ncbi:DpnD/PcfM family protein [Clostridium sp. C1]|uniref:DpnD/PcfM family protein n=1 Tax=Clostridium sp. C1 TaxID=1155388 RepID=UPI001BAD9D5D|nr:DpnD/PcfM family protein [Clostridium sp. C1]QUN12742.1 DpnD/PcfM family protein [Clostridium sp. C1]